MGSFSMDKLAKWKRPCYCSCCDRNEETGRVSSVLICLPCCWVHFSRRRLCICRVDFCYCPCCWEPCLSCTKKQKGPSLCIWCGNKPRPFKGQEDFYQIQYPEAYADEHNLDCVSTLTL